MFEERKNWCLSRNFPKFSLQLKTGFFRQNFPGKIIFPYFGEKKIPTSHQSCNLVSNGKWKEKLKITSTVCIDGDWSHKVFPNIWVVNWKVFYHWDIVIFELPSCEQILLPPYKLAEVYCVRLRKQKRV